MDTFEVRGESRPGVEDNAMATSQPTNGLMLALYHPLTLSCLGVCDTVMYRAVCRWMCERCDAEDVWEAISQSFGRQHGCYVPKEPPRGESWAKLARLMAQSSDWVGKFAGEKRGEGFDIRVNVRFRPGRTMDTGLIVPLHQRLMLLESGETLVQVEPEEFKDALMGCVMSDPVRLPSSGKVCDRKVVDMHLRRSGTDPFDRTPLTREMLVPCADLKQRIEDYKAKADVDHEKKRVDAKGMKELSKRVGRNVAMEVLEVLAEAERLKALALRMARTRNKKFRNLPLADGRDVGGSASSDEEDGVSCDDRAEGLAAELHAADLGGDVVKAKQAGGYTTGPDAAVDRRARDQPRVLDISSKKIMMFQPGKGVRPYTFHACYDGGNEESVYDDAARHAVVAALNGKNASVMCYGQTGSGKTHTMFGPSIASGRGVALRCLAEVMAGAEELRATRGLTIGVSARYLQIYHNKLFCLLSRAQIKQQITADGAVVLTNSVETPLTCYEDALDLLHAGEKNKRFAETRMNAKSSRSHTVLVLEMTQLYNGVEVTSCLNLIDLAGSERVKKSGAASGLKFREAVEINKSLSALGRCITGLVEAAAHIPFHDSKLTLLLKPFLQPGCLASLIVCARKDDEHAWETTQSLAFAESCTAISSTARKAAGSGMQACLDFVDNALASCATAMSRINNDDSRAVLEKAMARLRLKRADLEQSLSADGPQCPATAAHRPAAVAVA